MKIHLKGFIAGVIVTVLIFSGIMTAFAPLPEIIWNNANASSGTFSVYLDGNLYKEYAITGNMSTQEIVIDVTGVQILQLTVSVVQESSGSTTIYGFGNVTIE